VSQVLNVGHITPPPTPYDLVLYIFYGPILFMHAKFQMSIALAVPGIPGVTKFKSRSRDPASLKRQPILKHVVIVVRPKLAKF